VSEKEAAAVRRDGGPLTIADQQLGQEDSAARNRPAEHRRERLQKRLHRQQTRILVRGQRPEDADPT
jgi:hypothetical protein